MTKLGRLPYVHEYTDNRGKLRRYFRRNGIKITLPADVPIDDPKFLRAYALAREGRQDAHASTITGYAIDSVIERYLRSPEFGNLAPSTQKVYRNILKRWASAVGADGRRNGLLPFDQMTPRAVRRMMANRADTPDAANRLLKMIKILWSFCRVESDTFKTQNPTEGVKRFKVKTDGFHSWTDFELRQFEERHPSGSKARLAYALALYTGQRRQDVVRAGWQHVQNNEISVVQEKTQTRLLIRLHRALATELDQAPRENLTFLLTEYNKPFAVAGFGNWFRTRCDEAELPQCSMHGLRKAAGRKLAELGLSSKSISSILGHKTLEEAEKYVRAADQRMLAADAITRWEKE